MFSTLSIENTLNFMIPFQAKAYKVALNCTTNMFLGHELGVGSPIVHVHSTNDCSVICVKFLYMYRLSCSGCR